MHRDSGDEIGLHRPSLDLDCYVPNLLRGIYWNENWGTQHWMAQIRRSSARLKFTR